MLLTKWDFTCILYSVTKAPLHPIHTCTGPLTLLVRIGGIEVLKLRRNLVDIEDLWRGGSKAAAETSGQPQPA